MLRPRAETMPAVTEPPRPNGLPIAITQSPGRILSESPKVTALSGLSDFTRSTARSTLESLPTISALRLGAVGEDDADVVGVADHVVVGDHDARGSMTKPEPSEFERRWRGGAPLSPCRLALGRAG